MLHTLNKPTVPDYTQEDIAAMLTRCRDDKPLLLFVSTILVAAGHWYKRAMLLALLHPVIYVGGFLTGYYFAGK